MIFLCYTTSREHEETERDTGGVGQDMSMPLKLFLVSKFCLPRRRHKLQPRSEVFSEKANFNDNGGFVVETHKHFSWDTRGLCFSWYTRGICFQGTQRINKSQFVFICVITQS